MQKQPPLKGHKCKGAQLSVRVTCECGWQSANWIGEGARRNAYGEWRYHIESCQKKEAAAA